MKDKHAFFDRKTVIRQLKVCFYVTLIIIVIPDLFIENIPIMVGKIFLALMLFLAFCRAL